MTERHLIADRAEAIRYLASLLLGVLGLAAAIAGIVLWLVDRPDLSRDARVPLFVFLPMLFLWSGLGLQMTIRSYRSNRRWYWPAVTAFRESVRLVRGN